MRTPIDHQRLFIETGRREALYGMHDGGGKTWALVWGALQHIHEPDYLALLVRAEHASLVQPGGLAEQLEYQLHDMGVTEYSRHARLIWDFTNGAKVILASVPDLKAAHRYGGLECNYLGIDEAGQIPGDAIEFLMSRVRSRGASATQRIRMTSNAGWPYQEWLRTRFGIGGPERLFLSSQTVLR